MHWMFNHSSICGQVTLLFLWSSSYIYSFYTCTQHEFAASKSARQDKIAQQVDETLSANDATLIFMPEGDLQAVCIIYMCIRIEKTERQESPPRLAPVAPTHLGEHKH